MEICNPECSAPCAIIAGPTLVRHGCIVVSTTGTKTESVPKTLSADWTREFDEPIPVPKDRQLVTLRDAGDEVSMLVGWRPFNQMRIRKLECL